MKHNLSFNTVVVVFLLLACAFVLLPRVAAHAATHVSHYAAHAAVSCSGDGCNGLDPSQTGCDDARAYTAQTAIIKDYAGNQIGLVELRFSPTCGTNWTRETSYVNNAYNQPSVHRIYDGLIEYGYGKNTVEWSDMVYAPDANSAWGEGCITMPDGASQYCAETPIG